ncbi:uncharacterized protein LOC106645528 [Copidosoma floridanum]|uniref:uncharacterized protein LOC106645528 n=1 Tax=Copidosoma floridanum TaxID=29053 RepID=UPI0006C9A402|nr:uncharacterized protein LOC106645528 [Copidosoma floridanum]
MRSIPNQELIQGHWQHLQSLELADLNFTDPAKPNFASSRDIAAACLAYFKQRLQRNFQLAESYRALMCEYIELQHMKPVLISQINRPSFYMPHHVVVSPDHIEKINVVFNASQKSNNGISLNDMLVPNPKLQTNIAIVLNPWRRFKIKILWRGSSNQPTKNYRCTTVRYGTASAPYLALRVMKQIAINEATDYPDAATVFNNTLCVDDLFVGADMIEEGLH